MKIALLADIHGNLHALSAVLEHIQQQEVDAVLCLGDVAVFGPQPHEVVQALRALEPLAVQGNTDAWALDPHPHTVHDVSTDVTNTIELWSAGRLTGEDREFLAGFTREVWLDLPGGRRLMACHGSPRANTETLDPGLPPEQLNERLDGVTAAVVSFAHTHNQGLFYHRGQLLFNPGSVGMPFRADVLSGDQWYAPWAEYALLEAKRDHLGVTFFQIQYDIEALVESAFQVGMPEAGWWVTYFERGLARGR